LITGDRAQTAENKLYEAGVGQYLDPGTGELPERAQALVIAYLDRMRASECTPQQLVGAESLLLAGARNRLSSALVADRSDEQLCADIDAAWDLVVRIVRREGIRL
jgi:hypothetical protein